MTEPIYIDSHDIAPAITRLRHLQTDFLADDPFDMISSLSMLYMTPSTQISTKTHYFNCFGVNRRFISFLKKHGIHAMLAIEESFEPETTDHAHAVCVIPYHNHIDQGILVINTGLYDNVYTVTQNTPRTVTEKTTDGTQITTETTYAADTQTIHAYTITQTYNAKKPTYSEPRKIQLGSTLNLPKIEETTALWLYQNTPPMGRIDYDALGNKWVTLITYDKNMFWITLRHFPEDEKIEAKLSESHFNCAKTRAKHPDFFDRYGHLTTTAEDAFGKPSQDFLDFVNKGIAAWRHRLSQDVQWFGTFDPH